MMCRSIRPVLVICLALALNLAVAGCHPGFVDNNCDQLGELSSRNFISQAFCKIGNVL